PSDAPLSVDGYGNHATPPSSPTRPSSDLYWVATYSGDSNNKGIASGCEAEPITVGPASPAIETTQKPATGIVGDTFKDSAKVSGLFGAHAGGQISWALYDNANCEGKAIASDGPVSVDGDGSYETPSGAAPSATGTYSWVATFSLHAALPVFASGCEEEPITVGPASPAIETTQKPATGIVGDTFKDSAKLSGLFGAHAGGQISWALYDNANCEGKAIASDGPVSVDGDGSYETPSGAAPSATGTYYWVATYSGDSNNKGIASGCEAEPIAVNPKPVVIVLPEKVISGEAKPHGPAACTSKSTLAYITGREIVSATFFLDGHKVKTLVKPDAHGRYGIKVNARKLKFGVHRVTVN